jgi:large subunit ribosomal protein L24
LLYSEELGRGVRTGIKMTEDGKKVRYCKKTGTVLD